MIVFMDKPNSKIFKEIAENLDYGNDCYYNLKTKEIIAIPSFPETFDEDEFRALFKIDLGRINEQNSDLFKIEILKSSESFKIMERFIDQLTEPQLKSKLKSTLTKVKPFQNFKYFIDNSEHRQKWFDFKQNELEKIVEMILINRKGNTN